MQNGYLSALPHLCLWWFSMPWGWFADYLIRTQRLGLSSVRKLSNAVGMLGPSIGLLCLAYARCDNFLTISSLCFFEFAHQVLKDNQIQASFARESQGLAFELSSNSKIEWLKPLANLWYK